MKGKTKAAIGCACVALFVAALIFYAWTASENQKAYEAIEQHNATTFQTEPTEAIVPDRGAVTFYFDDMHYVVEESTWNAKTESR